MVVVHFYVHLHRGCTFLCTLSISHYCTLIPSQALMLKFWHFSGAAGRMVYKVCKSALRLLVYISGKPLLPMLQLYNAYCSQEFSTAKFYPSFMCTHACTYMCKIKSVLSCVVATCKFKLTCTVYHEPFIITCWLCVSMDWLHICTCVFLLKLQAYFEHLWVLIGLSFWPAVT